ncbi:MAG: hypothetical protein U1E76_00280 [Planctomycetota bacterium]
MARSVVYTVPANQWLVVTNLEIYWINTGASIDLYEDAAGMLTLKRSSWFNGWGGNAANVTNGPYESPVGLAFAPGSRSRSSTRKATARTASTT